MIDRRKGPVASTTAKKGRQVSLWVAFRSDLVLAPDLVRLPDCILSFLQTPDNGGDGYSLSRVLVGH